MANFQTQGSSRHGSGSGKVDLALDLLTCPASGIESALAIVRVCADFTNK